MREPIVEHTISDAQERPWTLSVKRIHQRLFPIVEDQKNHPRGAKNENQAVEKDKRGKMRFIPILMHLVEPEKLGEGNKRNRTIARVDHGSKKERDG
jgi:hypothetical protein